MAMRHRLGLAILVIVVLGWTPAVFAHHPPAPAAPVPGVGPVLVAAAGTPAAAVFWLLGALALVGALAGSRFLRGAATVAVALLLVLFAFVSGLHSVHHLSDPGTRCVIASAATHLSGVEAASVCLGPVERAATDTLPSPEPPVVATPLDRPDAGRAPPA